MSSSIKPAKSVQGEIVLPGDKSIAHRSIFISSIAKGNTSIYNFPANTDCLMSLEAFKKLGVGILSRRLSDYKMDVSVDAAGLRGLKKPNGSIFCGESGTTYRLLLGILAGQAFRTTLTAAKSLCRRPMKRVTEPLSIMGAVISSQNRKYDAGGAIIEEYPPITIRGGHLQGITYKLPVASAQVKSAILLAALFAEGKTKISEPVKTRDHTERMLRDFGADIKIKERIIYLRGRRELVSPGKIYIPSDISSASFFMVAALLLPGSYLAIKSVGLNPSRMGIARVLKHMGADIRIIRSKSLAPAGEPMGDIIVKSSGLRAARIKASQIPQLIDELPILMLAACFAKGRTVIEGVRELRVKETDRIVSMQTNLRKMGADIEVIRRGSLAKGLQERIVINGVKQLNGTRLRSFGDHRTAMCMVIAGLLCKGQAVIDDVGCIDKSFPGFLKALKQVVKN